MDEIFSDPLRQRLRFLKHPSSGKVFIDVTADKSYGHVIRTVSYNHTINHSYRLTQSKMERLGLELGERYTMHAIPTKDERHLYVLEKIQFKEPGVRFVHPVVTVGSRYRTIKTKPTSAPVYLKVKDSHAA